MRRLPVESSRTELVAEVGDAEQLEQLLDARVDVGLGVGDEREVQRGARSGRARRGGARTTSAIVSRDGERREQATVLERATEPEPGAARRRQCA